MSKPGYERAEDGPGLDRVVGDRIRHLRRANRLSLEDVAGRCDVSIGFLSQIERGKSSPTLSLLTNLADVLGVPFSEFFVGNGQGPSLDGRAGAAERLSNVVVRAGRRQKLKLWRAGIIKQSLTAPHAGMPFSYYLMQMDKGATSGGAPYSHGGNEAGLVVQGRLRLTVEGECWELRPGDSFSFPSAKPHSFENLARRSTIVAMVHVP